ncbi:MAG: peptidylprolyl isomerase [Chloroflexi bacterium]|nr:peptidylprolyl isomerase [Chloroflexota bacterium]
MKRLSLGLAVVLVVLLAACANANPSTVAILGTNEASIATSTGAANNLATSVVLTQNAPTPTPTPTPAPIIPVVIAEYTPSADAQTPDQLCAAAAPVEPETRTFTEAEQVLEDGIDYRAIVCTEVGPVYVDLTEKETPLAVNSFVFLAGKGYFNGLTFHRVLADFMAQGGDPEGTGAGGPGYQFANEVTAALRFDAPGKLAMANAGADTNGSQFFITFGPAPNLDGGYTLFGQVVEGQANVMKITLRNPDGDPAPTEPGTKINTVLIVTDPTTVLLTDAPVPSREDVVAAFDGMDALLTGAVGELLENQKANQSTEEVIAAAPEAARADLETLLTSHNHQYRVSSLLNNTSCDTSQIPFYSASYKVDAFATASDAIAAIDDPLMDTVATESEFTTKETPVSLTAPLYKADTTACEKTGIHAMTSWRRGIFIVTAEVVWPADAVQGTDMLDRVLTELVGGSLYDALLVDVLYSDIQ